MSAENKAIVQRMVEIIQNQHQLERMRDFFEPNFVNHLDHDPASPLNSIEKAQQVFTQLFAALPDLRVTIQHAAIGKELGGHSVGRLAHQNSIAIVNISRCHSATVALVSLPSEL